MPTNWITAERGRIPDAPGCYVVFERDRVVYVGSTVSLRDRLRTYWRFSRPVFMDGGRTIYGRRCAPWPEVCGDDIGIKYRISKQRGDWLMIEYRLIDRLGPRFNRLGVTSGRPRLAARG